MRPIRVRKLGRCGWAGKDSYRTELDAKMAIGNQFSSLPWARRPVRAYPCPRGGHWHTTSKPKREKES